MIITGKLIDLQQHSIYSAKITIENGILSSIQKTDEKVADQYILPGFIDAHVHIESSMLVPTEFARMAVVHGSVATVSDPHEIANVLGVAGVEFMIENGRKSPFKFNFGAPSCVPATTFETAGAEIDVADIEYLMALPEIKYLAEMMNWPGVLFKDKMVYEKIAVAQKFGKPVDGHAPGLKGDDARNYIAAGISTDHECFSEEEAKDKLQHGMKILIREGSAAKNFEALIGLLDEHYESMMFCSDDKHPDSLKIAHIDALVKRALAKGNDLFKVLQVACINPIKHYNLDVGMLREGDPADFIVVDNPENLNILKTYIDGNLVAENSTSLLPSIPSLQPNNFVADRIEASVLKVKNTSEVIPVIEVIDGELITKRLDIEPKVVDGNNVVDTTRDLLKITVVNRYKNTTPAVAFIKNFGLQKGAIAGSVGHDSHNIIAVGASDEAIAEAVNAVIDCKGGLSVYDGNESTVLALPIAGLMTDGDGYQIAQHYTALDEKVKALGCQLGAPYMSLSFMALLVIPSIKLSDLGLFDGEQFKFIEC